MAFDSTVGGTDSNSYATVAEADDYFSLRTSSAIWVALDNTAKEQYLVTATSMLEAYVLWRGTPADEDQALHWPAIDAVDCAGNDIDDETIPSAVKSAEYEQAYYLLQTDSLASTASSANISEAKVGDLEVKYKDTTLDNSPDKIGSYISALIRCYGALGPGATTGGFTQSQILRA